MYCNEGGGGDRKDCVGVQDKKLKHPKKNFLSFLLSNYYLLGLLLVFSTYVPMYDDICIYLYSMYVAPYLKNSDTHILDK